MAPTIVVIRHAEGIHNVLGDWTKRDPGLTSVGLTQCANIQEDFQNSRIDVVIASPLRRTIMTALLCFGPHLGEDKRIILLPSLQEISGDPSSTGSTIEQIVGEFGDQIIDIQTYMTPGWESTGEARSSHPNVIRERARKARLAIREIAQEQASTNNPDPVIAVVTHGNFIPYLTGDFSQPGYSQGSVWTNTEFRTFRFQKPNSAIQKGRARLVETEDSLAGRGARVATEAEQAAGRALTENHTNRLGQAAANGRTTLAPSS
ncbi:histidine phosphatase superfamily [Hypoxylon crocopeplum]|nr:histidine phosphatase superfamily [Hypoxylon crocopeplum]